MTCRNCLGILEGPFWGLCEDHVERCRYGDMKPRSLGFVGFRVCLKEQASLLSTYLDAHTMHTPTNL